MGSGTLTIQMCTFQGNTANIYVRGCFSISENPLSEPTLFIAPCGGGGTSTNVFSTAAQFMPQTALASRSTLVLLSATKPHL